MVDLLIHSRIVVFLYVKCSFSLVSLILAGCVTSLGKLAGKLNMHLNRLLPTLPVIKTVLACSMHICNYVADL
jgi:hypothetical protein